MLVHLTSSGPEQDQQLGHAAPHILMGSVGGLPLELPGEAQEPLLHDLGATSHNALALGANY
jgi:hypothetical protein